MRKKAQTFTIDEEVLEMLKTYSDRTARSLSFGANEILRNFLRVEVGGKARVVKVPLGPYIDTPEDIEAGKQFLEKHTNKKEKTKSQEDIDFENSIKDAL